MKVLVDMLVVEKAVDPVDAHVSEGYEGEHADKDSSVT